jgi:formylglycine-generating enzyme required for sulfatase activity
VHEVVLDAYFLSKFETTQGQWERMTGANPAVLRKGIGERDFDATHPVENVSWDECVRWSACFTFTLPAEAQWEYACRAGTTTVFSTGEDPAGLLVAANVNPVQVSSEPTPRKDSAAVSASGGEARAKDRYHTAVGRYPQNPWGFHDMHGNVWEWCLEGRPEEVRYDIVAARAGDGFRSTPEGQVRLCRGGSFNLLPYFARSACRSGYVRDAGKPDIGVRFARSLAR